MEPVTTCLQSEQGKTPNSFVGVAYTGNRQGFRSLKRVILALFRRSPRIYRVCILEAFMRTMRASLSRLGSIFNRQRSDRGLSEVQIVVEAKREALG
jgi:hypothetical protein